MPFSSPLLHADHRHWRIQVRVGGKNMRRVANHVQPSKPLIAHRSSHAGAGIEYSRSEKESSPMKTRSMRHPVSRQQKSGAVAGASSAQLHAASSATTTDARALLRAQHQHQHQADNSRQAAQLKARAEVMASHSDTLQRVDADATPQGKSDALSLAAEPNNTGLPDALKSGIESLSGMSLNGVKVHFNSDKPAQMQAHAYAQGLDIHVGPGQEQHLPHEAWHVVQQAQGRVRPNRQLKGGVEVNDDVGLEREADEMGARASSVSQSVPVGSGATPGLAETSSPTLQAVFEYDDKVVPANVLTWARNLLPTDQLKQEFDDQHQLETAVELDDWLKGRFARREYNRLFHALEKQFPEDFFDAEESEEDADETLEKAIVQGLDEGRYGIRWATLEEKEKKEMIKRISGLIPVYRKLRGDKDSKEDFFIVHGSILWGAMGETPGDIDVIDSSGDNSKIPVKLDGLHRKPEDDIVKLSKVGSTLDQLLGVDFNVDLESDPEVFKWGEVTAGLKDLLKTGIQELGAPKTKTKGARKVFNAAFVVKHFSSLLPKAHREEFTATWAGPLAAANASISGGKTPEVSEDLAHALRWTWIVRLDATSQ